MRAKSFQIILTTSALFAFSARLPAEEDASLCLLDRNHVAPATALDEAVSLLPKNSKSLVSAAELDLCKKLAANVTSINETDTILIVENINDDASRNRYRAQLAKIIKEARAATADAKTDDEKADLLAKFLFKNPMHGGYVADQSDVRILLDTGKFNCVSSAILFNLIGGQLGLNTRCDTVPGHVFLRIGNRYVEATGGFIQNKEDHNKGVDKLWAEVGNTPHYRNVFGKERIYEHGNLGLIAEIYSAK